MSKIKKNNVVNFPNNINETEREFNEADKLTIESWAAMDSNLFFAGKYFVLVILDKYWQKTLSKFFGAFKPVPTAVPPCAK